MNSWTTLNEALSKLPFIEKLNDEKRQLDAIRPLSEEVEGRVMQKIRLEWNYHSNAIEGNKLTFGETYSFLMYGLTAKGKPLKDHLDIKGHNEAINFLMSIVKDDRDLTETEIRELHKMVLVEPYQSPAITFDGQKTSKTILIGEYKKQPNHVKTPTGEIHYYATPENVPVLMSELVGWYNEARTNKNIHPSVLAAFFHHRFVAIHPFDDGNGRIARILMNLILMQKSYPPAVVKLKERTDYYAVLGQADKNEYVPLIEFIAESVSDSINIYLKAAKGESIEDDTDLDKEIALFKIGLGKEYSRKTPDVITKVLNNFILKFNDFINKKLKQFDELFTGHDSCFGQLEIVNKNKKRTFNIQKQTIEQIYSLAKSNNLDHLYIFHDFFKFKKTPKIFDFKIKIRFDFYENKLNISNDLNTLFIKYYDEISEMSDREIHEIANKLVKEVLENLKKAIAENTPPQ